MKRRRAPAPALPALEWAEEISGGCARVTALGSRCLRVENHTGVLRLSDDEVVVDTRRGPLCVEGRGLYLCDVRWDALVVRGDIARVLFPCEGGGER